MKTAIVTTCWLDSEENFNKTKKWLLHHEGPLASIGTSTDVVLLDNGSASYEVAILQNMFPKVKIHRFLEHLPRSGHLEYPYLWRAVDHFKLLLETYDRVVYMDNDFYIISNRMIHGVLGSVVDWMSPWCTKHNMPETGLQVITKDSVNYRISYPFSRFNGQTMELVLPVTVEKKWIGDRHSEYGVMVQPTGLDYSAQVPLDMEIKWNK